MPKEMAYHGLTDMEQANRYLTEVYMPQYNEGFSHPAREQGTGFIQRIETNLDDILFVDKRQQLNFVNCEIFPWEEGLFH